jgi:hypothetical protein
LGNCIHGEHSSWQNGAWILSKGFLGIRFKHYPGEIYGFYYTFVDIEYTSITAIASEQLNILSFNLQQNYPNPFNPSTTIKYSIKDAGFVKLEVYDILGRRIVTLVNEERQPGEYEVNFSGHNLASGIYLYKISAGTFTQVRKMQLIK